jgi:hypothetical protein
MKNDVTLFSNGIGHFRRVYNVSQEETKISIPFKIDCIGDVAASLQVFGRVKLNTPASFTPANSHSTALRIDPEDAMKSMLKQLSGSKVKMALRGQNAIDYTLLGLEYEPIVSQNGDCNVTYVSVMNQGNISRYLLTEVSFIKFLDEGVCTEIEKSLKLNFQKIKPDSTLLDLSLSSLDEKEVEAIVQYTIPVAAWKMRYAIREDKGKFLIEGAAIIDNNTDEDWDAFKVSVVTGNPISFSTDIANVVVPQRRMVYLIDRLTQGNVDVEEGIMMMPQAANMRSSRSLGPKMSTANYTSFGLESAMAGGAPDGSPEDVQSQYLAAEAPGVESKDVGDFCVFTAKESITILARKSAVVPMFSRPIDSAGVVLLYKESNNARRPYRAVKFKNETEFTLGRGKTVIYNEGVFSGECVLENTKPGENRMLPHCLENGVKIIKEEKGNETRRSSIRVSDGVGVTDSIQKSQTIYNVDNKKDEPFKVAIEHSNQIFNANSSSTVKFEGVDVKEKEKLVDGNGWRIYFELKAKESLVIVVTETCVISSSAVLGDNFNWVRSNIINIKNPIATDKQIQVCINVQKEIDQVIEELQSSNTRLMELTQQVERVRSNCSAVKDKATSTTIDKWMEDLDSSEIEIREINKKIVPELNSKRKALMSKLSEELRKITVTWSE